MTVSDWIDIAMTDTAVDFLLDNLIQLINCRDKLVYFEKDQLESLYQELQFLRVFLKESKVDRDEHEEAMDVAAKIRDVTFEAEDILDSSLLYNLIKVSEDTRAFYEVESFLPGSQYRPFYFNLRKFFKSRAIRSGRMASHLKLIKSLTAEKIGDSLGGVLQQIESIKKEVIQIYEKRAMYATGVQHTQRPSHGASSTPPKPIPILKEGAIVGLEDEKTKIMELLLAGECQQQLKLVSIVGMPGLGKTTLATAVYNDPLVRYYFHIRGWACVSQEYRKRDLLLSIFCSAFPCRNEAHEMSDEKLGEELYKSLKGHRYLIVMDDIWESNAWDNLRIYFPNDKTGSRVMFTSRLMNLPLHAKPHHLRSLDENESWDLLQQKTFGKQSCPPELVEIGKQIVKKCGGLPLAIVVVSGLLARTDKAVDWWARVAASVSSHIVSDPEQYMGTLALSYNHLPYHLKPCFLYFGAFSEDSKIPVRKLMWLWVAEGFIPKYEQRGWEEVAEEYLTDLIDRNLVIASDRRSNGRVKACKMHDLLRDLCLRKAKEDHFLERISNGAHINSSPFPKHRRLCIRPICLPPTSSRPCCSTLHVRSFLTLGFSGFSGMHASHICQSFVLLRVLDVSSVGIEFFPSDLQLLVHLRYLALKFRNGVSPLLEVSKLCNLETLIVEGSGMKLPTDMWRMVKLKHLYISHPFKFPSFPYNSYSFLLDNVQNVGTLDLCLGDGFLKRVPNLRKLKCSLAKLRNKDCHFPKLGSLVHLETLNVTYDTCYSEFPAEFPPIPSMFPRVNDFPKNLKNLTLSKLRQPWEEMSTLGKLPNLEVLKLLDLAFEGPRWDTGDDEFSKLRFLKLRNLNIVQWNASSDHFPSLQSLVLDHCKRLKVIPSVLGDIAALEVIQLLWCTLSAARYAEQIQEEQQRLGYDGLKIFIDPPTISQDYYRSPPHPSMSS